MSKREDLEFERQLKRITDAESADMNKVAEEFAKDGVKPLSLSDAIRYRLALRSERMLKLSLEQIDAIVARHSTNVVVKVCGHDMTTCAGSIEIFRAMARAAFKQAKYWEFHATRLVELDSSTKAHMQRAYADYDMFAGDGTY